MQQKYADMPCLPLNPNLSGQKTTRQNKAPRPSSHNQNPPVFRQAALPNVPANCTSPVDKRYHGLIGSGFACELDSAIRGEKKKRQQQLQPSFRGVHASRAGPGLWVCGLCRIFLTTSTMTLGNGEEPKASHNHLQTPKMCPAFPSLLKLMMR